MELIAASRIVKAQARVHAAQPYAEGITDVVRNLQGAGGASNSALLTPRAEVRKVADIVIAADRGLCGGYNTTVIRAAEHDMREHGAGRPRERARHRRPQGRGLLPLPRLPDRRRVLRLQRQPHLRGRARRSRRPSCSRLRGRRARPRAARLHPVHLGRSPRGGRRAVAAARAAEATTRRPSATRASRAPTTSSSRTPTRSSRRCCRATPSRASTRRC